VQFTSITLQPGVYQIQFMAVQGWQVPAGGGGIYGIAWPIPALNGTIILNNFPTASIQDFPVTTPNSTLTFPTSASFPAGSMVQTGTCQAILTQLQ
jgi:hypothetical protein